MTPIDTGRLPRSVARPVMPPVAWAAALFVLTADVVPDGIGASPAPTVAICQAGTPAPTSSAEPGTAPNPEHRIPLPPIPKLEPVDHKPPDPSAVKELDGRLAELLETKVSGPLDAKFDLKALTGELGADMVAAIAQRVQELRGRLDGPNAEALLERARKAGRKALKKEKRERSKSESKQDGSEDDGDWLLFVLALERPQDPAWRDVAQLYGMLRMLETVGTTGAVRQMIDCYSYFGELVRIDIQRAIARLGDKSVAALIEARKHDTAKVARWANRMLDELGRAIAGEAVSSTDPEVLADVLRAFGRTRDVDAVRVILSFCSSDRVGIRSAAREAIGAIGEPASWQLREGYQQLTGEKPPRGWDWNRLARELFRLHDQARLAEVYRLADEGMRELGDKHFAAAAAAFDQVLARQPLFDARAEMAPAYVGLAGELETQKKRAEALAALRKALRLRPSHADNTRVEARIAYLESLELVEAGTPDRYLLERSIELDPTNEEARTLLATLEERAVKKRSRMRQYVGAAAIGLLAIIGMAVVALWPRRRRRGRTSGAIAGPPTANGTPATANGTPVTANGTPVTANATPATANDTPAAAAPASSSTPTIEPATVPVPPVEPASAPIPAIEPASGDAPDPEPRQ